MFANPIKSSEEEVIEILDASGAKPKKMESLCGTKLFGCIRVEDASAINKPECQQAMMMGKFSIADAASQAIVLRAMGQIVEPTNMLEICAGRGNKTLMFQGISHKF